MGLDMNLYGKMRHDVDQPVDDEGYAQDYETQHEVVYWRKANQIFGWFERNVANNNLENCEYYEVTQFDLAKLVDVCKLLLEQYNTNRDDAITNAKNLLPTQSKFFFGSTEYDDGYFEDLKHTVDRLSEVIDTFDWEEEDLFFHAWW